MAIITIEDKKLKLSKTNFVNINDLLTYLLSLSKSKIEFEEFNKEEQTFLENRLINIKNLESSINLLITKS